MQKASIWKWPAAPRSSTLNRRTTGYLVLSDRLPLAAPPDRTIADWQRDSQQLLALEPGDVEPLPLARTRMRWPGCKQAMDLAWQWMSEQGMETARTGSEVALMACRGAACHHDGERYGDKAFLNLFLTDDEHMDLYFPVIDIRIPLGRGTIVLFDTYQPHTVVARGEVLFDHTHFLSPQVSAQVFLTWEVPISHAEVARQLSVAWPTLG